MYYPLNSQRQAFLDTLAVSEIGAAELVLSDNGYNVIVGSTPENMNLFTSYADHPHVFVPAMNSDAAGRYQAMGWIWAAYKPRLCLPDFGPASQDQLALQLANECHALQLIDTGNITNALIRCNSRWASLPMSQYGQHTQNMDTLVAAFQAAGGTVTT